MEHTPSLYVTISLASQEILLILCNPKFRYPVQRTRKLPLLFATSPQPMASHLFLLRRSLVLCIHSCLRHFIGTLRPDSVTKRLCLSSSSCILHSHANSSGLIGNPSTICWRIHTIKLLSMQFPPVSFYYLPPPPPLSFFQAQLCSSASYSRTTLTCFLPLIGEIMFPVNIGLALLPVTYILHCAFLQQYGAETPMFVV